MKNVKRLAWYFLVVVGIVGLAFTSFSIDSSSAKSIEVEKEAQETMLVEVIIPDQDALDSLVKSGYDLTGYVSDRNGVLEVHAVVTTDEMDKLEQQGYEITTIQTAKDVEKILKQREQTMQQEQKLFSAGDNIKVFRADYFTNQSGTFLYMEAKSSAGANVGMNAQWTDANGEEQNAVMTRKIDAGVYLYHYVLTKIDSVPENVVITTNQGGMTETTLTEWIKEGTPVGDDYFSNFISHYMTPTEVTERIEQLAEEFPELAEIVELPYKTNGYRRHAQATIGSTVDAALVLTSKAWGHEGGNDITVDIQAPDQENHELEVLVEDNHITIVLGTDGSSQPTSTANEVIDAINAAADDLVTATNYRNSGGNGVVQAESNITLTDGLNASAEVSREPYQVKAIRIGKERDGSKPGILGYSQEHAREWVTPLVSVEAAERLLRNYYTDESTKELVDNLDIFIVPTVNPDGGHYSFYDYNSQRKNLVNYCGPETSDPGYRNSWGVDLNRNHAVGSVYDGWIGGSTNCLSGTYAGPEPESEPEALNLLWLAEENPNIKYAMNIHAYGGYFMWSPGAYDENRNPLPRPTAGEEAYYWQASEHILSEIKNYRGTVILPGRTGPIPDVLYSAGGNSADALWYNHDIYAWNFEVGADLWDEDRNRWVGVGFQPDFEEGHAEAMEFANGLIGLFEVALENANDDVNPETTLEPGEGTYNDPVEVKFEMSEPATVYYTLDGSRPTLESDTILVAGTRDGAETLTIDETTIIKWFSVDMAGNYENGYNPEGDGTIYNEARIVIDYLPVGVNALGIKALVERFENEGEFNGEVAPRNLKSHLTTIHLYERLRDSEKVIKQLSSFRSLLDQQLENELISGKAYRILESYTQEMIDLWSVDFESERAMEHIHYLSVDIGPRVAGSDAEKQAADYIKNEFERLGYEVSKQEFDIRGGKTSENVIAVKKPRGIENPEIIYVTAHYDSVPGSPGANDDASGTAAMLELARNMNNIITDKEIRFIAFGAEEIGLVGSRYYVDQLSDAEIENSVINFQLEMLGSIWEPANKLMVNTVDGNPNLVWNHIEGAAESLNIDSDLVVLIRRGSSDHVPFHNVGIDAAALNMGPGNNALEPWYHSPEDTFDKISPERIQFSGDLLNSAIQDFLGHEEERSRLREAS
jgi:hypothetical protein